MNKAIIAIAGFFIFMSAWISAYILPPLVLAVSDCRAACERIVESRAAGGARLDQVVKATVWLSDMGHFAGFNEVYKEFFGAALPVRSTVASALALNVDVEIEVQAYIGND